MMAVYYGKPVILLIDEYDVPLAKASTHGYYQEMLEVMRAMMSTCLKDNRNLSFADVTGCLRIAKESIFTGTNKMERSDVVVSDSDHDCAAVFEVKIVREKLEPACTAAPTRSGSRNMRKHIRSNTAKSVVMELHFTKKSV